mmetsp:Transcript_67065/g.218330  ORF Transcript_67065/g.218330 Transcript_67065/m.218330 type:complete len:276 (-) Transcript_67065:91-918(-)
MGPSGADEPVSMRPPASTGTEHTCDSMEVSVSESAEPAGVAEVNEEPEVTPGTPMSQNGSMLPSGSMTEGASLEMMLEMTNLDDRFRQVMREDGSKIVHIIKNARKEMPKEDDRQRQKSEERASKKNGKRKKTQYEKAMQKEVEDYRESMKERLRKIGMSEEQIEEEKLFANGVTNPADAVVQSVMKYHQYCQNSGLQHYVFSHDQESDDEEVLQQDEDEENEDERRVFRSEEDRQEYFRQQDEQRRENREKLERARSIMERRQRLPKMIEALKD